MKASEQTLNKIKAVNDKARQEIFNLLGEEASETEPYKVGDIIRDHHQIGEIWSVRYQLGVESESYNSVYTCKRLKKDLTQYKSEEVIQIYGGNVKEKLTK
jgi:hypothetical protein